MHGQYDNVNTLSNKDSKNIHTHVEKLDERRKIIIYRAKFCYSS